jgi:protein-tyrosine kinase
MRYETLRRAGWSGLDLTHEGKAYPNDPGDPAEPPKSSSLPAENDGVIFCPTPNIYPRDLSRLPVDRASPPAWSRLVSLDRSVKSMGAERLRLLRIRLWELRRLGTLNSVAITSSLPKEGKSTVALNLATTLSDGNRFKVLLVEADLHCPQVGANLGIPDHPGVCDCLEHGADPFLLMRRIEPLGFFLLQAGATDRHPTDLIQSRALPGLLAAVTPHFDWVIIDTPPVFPVADTISICQSADAVLFVVRSGVTPRESVDEALEMIGPGRIGAIVLNAAEDLNRSYYKYSSSYGAKK